MRVCILIHELGRSGGAQTVVRYAAALPGAELVITSPHADDLPADAGGVPIRRLADASGQRYDCAIATWWDTALSLWSVEAARRVVFLQSLESRFYEEHHYYERFAAESVLALPVDYVAVALWLRDALARLRPDARCTVVRNGIDKDVFRPRASAPGDGPLRVLIEGQPSMWFKGVGEAVEAVRAMEEPVEATLLAGEPEAAGEMGGVRVTGGLDAAGVAATYAAHDVVLKLSRVEGLALGPIEAFHVGVPAVLTPYTGHDEYARHGHNALLVGFDDIPGTARALDGLARDRARLRKLGEGALATATNWPSAAEADAGFANAVAELCAGPQPDADVALRALQRAQRRWLELSRAHARQAAEAEAGLRGAVEWHENALAEAAARHRELDRERAEAGEREMEAWRRLEEVEASRAYRVARAARRLKPGSRG